MAYMGQRQKREELAARLAVFTRKYGRKAQRSKEPNDRQYDRDLEKLVKRMDPMDLDALLHGEIEDTSASSPI
jgi:hypothetical protein